MKMNFVNMAFAVVLLTGFAVNSAETTPTTKNSRKTASKVTCVELNKPFDTSILDEYSLEEIQNLRNSIFAQYGYKFTKPTVAAEMKSRGCTKDGVTYKYSNVSAVDRQNIRVLKAYESSLKEASGQYFDKSWAKAKPNERKEMLKYAYCNATKANGKFLGLMHFGQVVKQGKLELSGLFDFKNAKYTDEEGNTQVLDSTSASSLDSTSMSTIDLNTKGTWTVDSSGDVMVSIAPATKGTAPVKVNITSEQFAETRILGCQFAK